jgi:hypothetical protein
VYLDAEFRRVWRGLGKLAGALEEGGAEARYDPRLLPATHHRVGLPRPSLPVGKQACIVPCTPEGKTNTKCDRIKHQTRTQNTFILGRENAVVKTISRKYLLWCMSYYLKMYKEGIKIFEAMTPIGFV